MDGNFRLLENFADVVVYNRHNHARDCGYGPSVSIRSAVVGRPTLRVDEVSLM